MFDFFSHGMQHIASGNPSDPQFGHLGITVVQMLAYALQSHSKSLQDL